MMRGTPGMRLTMAILSPVFLLLCVVAIHSEETRPWMATQAEFNKLYKDLAGARLKEAQGKNDTSEIARWQRVLEEVAQRKPEVAQIYMEDLKIADRCTTCHLGIDNPLFKDAPQPFTTHSGDTLKRHDPNVFGCTPCHQGQGGATTISAAHGQEENWLTPMLPAAYVQSSCARCHEVTHGLQGAERVTHGTDLFMEKGCYGCHDVSGIEYLPKFAPPLNGLRSKLTEPQAWIYAWLKEPAHFNPDTAMPNFMLADDEAGKITAFLLTLTAEKANLPTVSQDGSAEDGRRLFVQKGCRGCHAVDSSEHSVTPRVPTLAGVGSKITPAWLDAWIADPKKLNPDSAMPRVELTDEERHSIVAYLLTLKRKEPLAQAPDLSRFTAEEGKQLVKLYECYGCHTIAGFEKVRPSVPSLAEFARRPVDELDFGTTTAAEVPRTKWDWLQRKLTDPRAYNTDKIKLKMPLMPLAKEDVEALINRVLAFDTPTLPARYARNASPAQLARREGHWMVAHLNCNGCHRVNEKDPRIAQFFERKNQVPPTLDGVGARLQGQYMYQFVLEPKQVRPWLRMRMPNFGLTEAQARTLLDGFAAVAEVSNPYTYVAKENVDPEHFQRGIRRFRHYKCVQCHPTSIDEGLPEGVDSDDLSINLMLSKSRLRPEWIRKFLARPKQMAGPQTRMPTVFYTIDGVPKVEKAEEDINDITTYLMAMTEPPEETLQAEEESKKAEEQKGQDVDWSNMQY